MLPSGASADAPLASSRRSGSAKADRRPGEHEEEQGAQADRASQPADLQQRALAARPERRRGERGGEGIGERGGGEDERDREADRHGRLGQAGDEERDDDQRVDAGVGERGQGVAELAERRVAPVARRRELEVFGAVERPLIR